MKKSKADKAAVFEVDGDDAPRWFTADVETKAGKSVVHSGTMRPLATENLSILEQAIMEVLAEEITKAKDAGIKNPRHTLTKAMVDAKVKELEAQKNK